jgi:photosynthetic reaction center H subunit
MIDPNLVGTFDVAELVVFAFFLFFIGLVVYLRREDRREGYPLESEEGRLFGPGGVLYEGAPKTFRLPHGLGTATTPTKDREPVDIAARRIARFPGAPLAPTGNPLADGIGPAAFANRAKRPDLAADGRPRIVPLRMADQLSLHARDPNLVGMKVIAADGQVAGTISDVWVDRAEHMIRYLDVNVGGRSVLAPMAMATVRRGHVSIDAITAAQFAGAPAIAAADQITLYEEERIVGYFGGGYLYATPQRQEPLV